MTLVEVTNAAVWKWTHPALPLPSNDAESVEARAERSLAHIDALLERRHRWRHRARVAALLALPVVLTLMARQARGPFA